MKNALLFRFQLIIPAFFRNFSLGEHSGNGLNVIIEHYKFNKIIAILLIFNKLFLNFISNSRYITGTAPVVEIFENRIEVTNPGTPLVDVLRIIDNPPKSRNEKLASLMRRLKMCEELGRGWDRMVLACEAQFLPAPRIEVFQDSTKVTLFSEMEFSNIPMEDKLWSCYLHACLMYIQGDALTNKSLRNRFGIPETSSSSSSRLIREAIEKNLIKVLDPNTAPRYMKYIPIWA